MKNHLIEEIEYLRRENKRLKLEHAFAFESWQQAIKRSGRLSADLSYAKTCIARLTTDDVKTRVAPYRTIVTNLDSQKTIVVKRVPPPIPLAAYRDRR